MSKSFLKDVLNTSIQWHALYILRLLHNATFLAASLVFAQSHATEIDCAEPKKAVTLAIDAFCADSSTNSADYKKRINCDGDHREYVDHLIQTIAPPGTTYGSMKATLPDIDSRLANWKPDPKKTIILDQVDFTVLQYRRCLKAAALEKFDRDLDERISKRQMADEQSTDSRNASGTTGFTTETPLVRPNTGDLTGALSSALSAYATSRHSQSAAQGNIPAPRMPAAVPRPSGSSKWRVHPEGDAHDCLRANNRETYGGVTNTCAFAVSYIHCHINPTKDKGDSYAFHCDRPNGLWADAQPAGMLGPGKTDHFSFPEGGSTTWIACREPFGIREARYNGRQLEGYCVE